MAKVVVAAPRHASPLRPLTIAAIVVASIGLTAICCFASGYVVASQLAAGARHTGMDPSATTGLSGSLVPEGAAASESEMAEGEAVNDTAPGTAARAVDGNGGGGPGGDEEAAEEPYQHVRVEYSKLYVGWPCKKDERLFQNLCYIDCGKATEDQHPFRVDSCTCCKEVPCVQLAGRFTKNCEQLDVGDDDFRPAPPPLPNCHTPNEELFMGLCYKKCSILTKSKYPTRTGMNTCSSAAFGANWTMGIGPCSGFGIGGDNCLPHIPLPTGMGYSAEGEAGYPPMGFGYVAMKDDMKKEMIPPLLLRPR